MKNQQEIEQLKSQNGQYIAIIDEKNLIISTLQQKYNALDTEFKRRERRWQKATEEKNALRSENSLLHSQQEDQALKLKVVWLEEKIAYLAKQVSSYETAWASKDDDMALIMENHRAAQAMNKRNISHKPFTLQEVKAISYAERMDSTLYSPTSPIFKQHSSPKSPSYIDANTSQPTVGYNYGQKKSNDGRGNISSYATSPQGNWRSYNTQSHYRDAFARASELVGNDSTSNQLEWKRGYRK